MHRKVPVLQRYVHMSINNQFLRFALVGLAGTAVQYLVLWLGVRFGGVSAPFASGVGFFCGSVVNYRLNYLFTFRSAQSHLQAASRYYLVLAVGICLNTALMVLFVRSLNWNYWLGQICTTGVVLFWNFAGSRWWAFRHAAA
jgi:putative flippase GtrA